jgi:multicomponent Na+:H+ antiporter subunit E
VTTYLRAGVTRGLTLAIVWWAVSEGETYGWYYGAAVVVLATTWSLRLHPPRGEALSPREAAGRAGALLSLTGWFVTRSFAGGIDVARRALSRRLDIDPGLVRHTLAIPPGRARTVVVGLISLMPGTLSAELDGDALEVHSLDIAARARVGEQVVELEDRVGRVSGWTRG